MDGLKLLALTSVQYLKPSYKRKLTSDNKKLNCFFIFSELCCTDPCFKYRPIRPRYRLISLFFLTADTIRGNRSPYRLQKKNCRYLKYRPINCPILADKSSDISPDMNNLFIARLRANLHYFLLSLQAYYIIFIR